MELTCRAEFPTPATFRVLHPICDVCVGEVRALMVDAVERDDDPLFTYSFSEGRGAGG